MGKAKKRTAKVGRGKMGEAGQPPPRLRTMASCGARLFRSSLGHQLREKTRYRSGHVGATLDARHGGLINPKAFSQIGLAPAAGLPKALDLVGAAHTDDLCYLHNSLSMPHA